MGLLDGMLGQVLGGNQQAGGNSLMGLVSALLQNQGGLEGLLKQFKQAGLADQAASWVSTGDNQPINADQIKAAVGESALSDLAAKFGLSAEAASASLADLVPAVVDKLTPNGKVETGDISLDTLTGVLGKLFKG